MRNFHVHEWGSRPAGEGEGAGNARNATGYGIGTAYLEVVVRGHAIVRQLILGGSFRLRQELLVAPGALVLKGRLMETAVTCGHSYSSQRSMRNSAEKQTIRQKCPGVNGNRLILTTITPAYNDNLRSRYILLIFYFNYQNLPHDWRRKHRWVVGPPPPTSSNASCDPGVASAPVKAIRSGLIPTPCNSLKSRGMCRNGGLFCGFPHADDSRETRGKVPHEEYGATASPTLKKQLHGWSNGGWAITPSRGMQS